MAASASAEPAWRTGAGRWMAVLWAALMVPLIAACLALYPRPAAAHPMPESQVWIDTTRDGLVLTLLLPLDRLELAYGQPLAQAPQQVLPAQEAGLARYLLQHVGARGGGAAGLGWQVLRPQLSVQGQGPGAELQARVRLVAPAGSDARNLTLLYDVITHEVRTHRVRVLLRNDWIGGLTGQPLALGELRTGVNRLDILLGERRPGASVVNLVRVGAQHIAEGTDHLLFLLMLLVVAPLLPQGTRWGPARGGQAALRHVAGVVTCFTLGHSATLVLGSLGWLRPPVSMVEVAVAGTIGVAAVHAWRPLFARAVLAMAVLFGLVHGLAFSASLGGAGLTTGQHAQALLAFNLGIEAMQLLLTLLVMPALWLLLRCCPAAYAALRRGGAALALLMAALWAAERLGLGLSERWPWLDAAGALAWALLPVLLWGAAALAWWRRRPVTPAWDRG